MFKLFTMRFSNVTIEGIIRCTEAYGMTWANCLDHLRHVSGGANLSVEDSDMSIRIHGEQKCKSESFWLSSAGLWFPSVQILQPKSPIDKQDLRLTTKVIYLCIFLLWVAIDKLQAGL